MAGLQRDDRCGRLARPGREGRAHWYYSGGKLVSDDKPGPAGHHGLRLPCKITARNLNHPIMKGLPRVWMHQADELYDTLRGQAKT